MASFGASRATVAKAMRELEYQGLVDRRPGSGSFVRETSAPSGAKLATTIVADKSDVEFFQQMTASVASSGRDSEISFLLGADCSAFANDERAAVALCRRYIDLGVRGAFFAPCELRDDRGNDLNRAITETLSEAGVVVVLLDRDVVPFPRRSRFDLVGIDNFEAGFIQAEHLIERGCKRLVYASRSGALGTMDGRCAGFRYALERAGLPFDEDFCLVGDAKDVEFAKRILKREPDGVACFHDPIAIELLNNFQKLKVAVPEQIKIIGLDNVKYSNYLTTPLTTLSQPLAQIGAQAVERMTRRLNGETGEPKQILYSATLIPRRSTETT